MNSKYWLDPGENLLAEFVIKSKRSNWPVQIHRPIVAFAFSIVKDPHIMIAICFDIVVLRKIK